MKPMVYVLAALMGIGSGAIASAECTKQETNVVTFWRYEMVTVTPLFDSSGLDHHERLAVDRHHPSHPVNQDRIYHRTVVVQLPETDMYNASFEVIHNPNPVHRL